MHQEICYKERALNFALYALGFISIGLFLAIIALEMRMP